jgi:transaldolase
MQLMICGPFMTNQKERTAKPAWKYHRILAKSSQETIEEASRLWAAVERPNLMVKVPGTEAGAPAVRRLIEDGLNVNVTLLFSQDAYHAVAEAFLAGLEARVKANKPIDSIASVASFFVSRADAQIDSKIDERIKQGDAESEALRALRGKVAIANAKLAYAWYLEIVASPRWQALASQGAMPQRLLWASTGTKDPSYSPTFYADALIGPGTVNTMPPKTLEAFREQGKVTPTLPDDIEGARHVLAVTERLGLDLSAITTALVEDDVEQFTHAADKLLAVIGKKRAKFTGSESTST